MFRPSASSHRPPPLPSPGPTPLLALPFSAEGVTLYAKAEYLLPSGSIKDRLAATVFNDLLRTRAPSPDLRVVEVSSGNTGIALATLGARLGIKVHILMSDSASAERCHLIRHLGAELTLFRANQGYLSGIALAEQMAATDPEHTYLPRQFENPRNVADHATHTGPEILAQIPHGQVDAFVAGYGTGGTLAGCGAALREPNPDCQLVAVEAVGGHGTLAELPCCELIEGFTGGFQPPLLRQARLDRTERVDSAEAFAAARRLARDYGLFVGPSSGANIIAALRVARELGPAAQVATVLCDRADRYLSTQLFPPIDAFDVGFSAPRSSQN
ncbi:PLP-dependent cysteine synthase family protein [Actomonas aquatica]|uniref:Cysteine synthase family protein n=1 Tax=Actomonas aquatica TaxID=2866162 RepID=A0ABZ1C6V0_9BACT|nr:cysteine synthase family protein [Opitutus sp. WL0086]WRQ86259.1 cysteine synthase family protein [Opitutus sp. WL0086]